MHAVRVDVLRGAGGGARAAAVADADSVAVSERGLRARDGRGGRACGRRGVHARRVRRSVPRGCPAISRGAAGGHRADAAVPAVRRRHGGAGARDDCRRPARAHHLRQSEGARSSFAGREFDAALLDDLPPSVDPCGERGEFHTCAYAGPMFSDAVADRNGRHRRARRLRVRRIWLTPNDRLTMTIYPDRIVCLTEETTETLYLLGQGDRVVGVSGYTVRPPEARAEAEGLGVHQREVRQDRGARARPRARVLRSPGGPRRGAGPARHRRRRLQPAHRRRDPADDPMLGGLVGCQARGRAARRSARPPISTASASRPRGFPRGCACSSKNGTTR